MTVILRLLCLAPALVAATVAAGAAARAQAYPDRAIEPIVPFPPGGPADIVARPLAEGPSRRLGRPVIVLDKSGASGGIGTAFVAGAKPDGYTLLMATSDELTMSPGLPDAAEAGFPEEKVFSFDGVLAPAETSRPIIDKLNAAVLEVTNTPGMKAQLAKSVGRVSTSTPEDFAEILKSDFERWRTIIRANDIHSN